MKFAEAVQTLERIPHISPAGGLKLYSHIIENECTSILELGFAHGTSACYMAAALDEIGSGLITTIDLPSALKRKPDIYSLLSGLGLQRYVDVLVCDGGYNWELKRLIEHCSQGHKCIARYDFVFIDGAHTWEVDGLAFFLAEKLLRPGGWMLFDDLKWTLASSPSMGNLDWVKKLPEDMREEAQVQAVYSLLGCQHPSFQDHWTDGGWGWLRKSLNG